MDDLLKRLDPRVVALLEFFEWVIRHKASVLDGMSRREQGDFTEMLGNARAALADIAPDPLADPRVGLTQAATIAEIIMQKHAKAHYSGEAVRVFKSGDDTLSESAAKAYCAGEILEAIRAALAALSPTGGNDE